jgi:ABC-type transport system involved in cytochrome c biogenesis permease subunit
MRRKSVGAILSALVFPGVGQYYLGRRTRALLFLVPAAVAAILYFSFALDQANTMADQVLSGKVALDPAAIEAQLAGVPTPVSVTLAGIVFAVCWVGSIVEALIVKPRA